MDPQDRLHVAIALVVLLLLGGATWVMIAMRQNEKLEACLMARGRNCEQFR